MAPSHSLSGMQPPLFIECGMFADGRQNSPGPSSSFLQAPPSAQTPENTGNTAAAPIARHPPEVPATGSSRVTGLGPPQGVPLPGISAHTDRETGSPAARAGAGQQSRHNPRVQPRKLGFPCDCVTNTQGPDQKHTPPLEPEALNGLRKTVRFNFGEKQVFGGAYRESPGLHAPGFLIQGSWGGAKNLHFPQISQGTPLLPCHRPLAHMPIKRVLI